MPYTPFNPALPNGGAPANQSGPAVLQSVRNNLKALRDAVVLRGLSGFNCVASGGTVDQPALYTYTGVGVNVGELIKGAVTWGTTGGAAGNPESVAYTYSNDSGTTYSAVGTLTVTYTAGGYFSSYAWS